MLPLVFLRIVPLLRVQKLLMNFKDIRAGAQVRAEEEARRDAEQQARIAQRLRRWKRWTIWLGVALGVSIAAIVPFLYGFPLHRRWDFVGKKILLLSMGLLPVFMYVAATTYNLWCYLRTMKRDHQTFAPPIDKLTARRGRRGG